MSIKKLFGSTDSWRNYLSDTNERDAYRDTESAKNVAEIYEKQQRFIPQVDYSDPANFAKYGSARLYYNSAISRIVDYYPYDGSEYEITEYHNKSLDIEEYVFDNLYPRTNGYVRFSAGGWGDLDSIKAGYGLPDDQEYIAFTGGPHTIGVVGEHDASSGVITSGSTVASLFPDDGSSRRAYSNVYDEAIYTSAGLESGSYLSGSGAFGAGSSYYGTGSRESNLECNFDKGITIEFWLKKPAFDDSKTHKEVIFDIWNGEPAGQHDYGRVTLALSGAAEGNAPFILTVRSGSTAIAEKALGSSQVTKGTVANGTWKHYAVTVQNSGSKFLTKLYVTGTVDFTGSNNGNLGTLPSKTSAGAMGGRIGALITAASGFPLTSAGAGKLSASLDEFRFWKVARTSDEIGKNWFTHVRGGTNTDISNTTLGLYYKFNEGITGTESLDNSVLDYSGRLSNGNWVGYDSTKWHTVSSALSGTNGRATGSAIIEASASAAEYKDPIIRSTHSDVANLKEDLLSKGANHDFSNNAAFKSLIPSWVVEEQEYSDGKELVPTYDNNIEMVSHVVGAYFDKLRLQIKSLPSLRYLNYTSASNTPYPFAQHLPQSLGLYMPEVFVDSTVLEKFMNRNPTMLFEGDLNETKNLIYQNIYNNLANIYKSKGTEKAIRNVFRCFGVDDKLLRLNVYSNNETYELKDNLRQTLINKKVLNFNESVNANAVVYQAQDPGNAESRGWISGSTGVGLKDNVAGVRGYEVPYGFTAEADIIFPHYSHADTRFIRDFTEVSLFGMHSASTDDTGTRPLNDTTWYANDNVSFQVYAVRDEPESKNVYFKLTSSLTDSPDGGSTTDLAPFPILTSSYFYDVYDDTRWNISVRLKPTNFGVTDMVSGAANNEFKYQLVFQGLNSVLGTIQNSFTLTASIPQDKGTSFLTSSKRMYVGARRTNITGAIVASSDVLFNGVKYWAKYLDDTSLHHHAYDLDNAGISGSWRNVSPLDSNLIGPTHGASQWLAGTGSFSGSILNSNMLALDWRFNNITSSGILGGFPVTDHSSGSVLLRDNYSWIGGITGKQHTGTGSFFPVSSQGAVVSQSINAFQFINPEYAVSSDMIRIPSTDDINFGSFETPPSYRYTLEKSMHNAISEEMLDFFAGVVDFHNVIGEPVNRYRGRYKRLEKLREIFFRRVTEVKHVEKFIDYYKWFDDAIAIVIGQLLPASADFNEDTYNTIESHVLERNKYRTKYPTLERRDVDPEGSATSYGTWGAYRLSPAPGSARPTNKNERFWKFRALPGGTIGSTVPGSEIASDNSNIDSDRKTIRTIMSSRPKKPQKLPRYRDTKGNTYTRPQDDTRQDELFKIAAEMTTIHGGVNFKGKGNKNIHFTYNALYPAGPVNRGDGGIFVPLNTLYFDTDNDMVRIDEIIDNVANWPPNRKLKRFGKVQHGRNWENGGGYSNVKSTFAFPFNIMSSSVTTGYNKAVVDRVSSSLEITNLHNDAYGDDMEIPMQSPFTNWAVGGHQSRHVPFNTGSTLDTIYTRAEAWKILLGKCPNESGAIGMVGPDYPYPEADGGVLPYPVTASMKAPYYRDFIAKRPVNIRNIHQATSSQLGNYRLNLEVVSTVGSFLNPRRFIDQQPVMPTPVTDLADNVNSASTNVVSFFSTIHRDDESHFDFGLTYAPTQFTGSDNKTVIVSRFGAPGGPETMARGFLDIRGGEYSPYNAHTYRNLSVIKPFQASSSISQATGSGVPGIRAYDQLGKDYGLRILLARRSARFGRDSRFETAVPGATYDQLPSFQKVNRNNITLIDSSSSGYASASQYDNFYVQHPIPRAFRQYAWISASLISANNMLYNQYQPTRFGAPDDLLSYVSTSAGYISFLSGALVSGSTIETTTGIYQPTTRLNIFTIDPVTASLNTVGHPSESAATNYFNSTFIDALPAADSTLITASAANYFNLLMTRRKNTYGWNWTATRQGHNPVHREEVSGTNLSLTATPDKISIYRFVPVSMKGRPISLNISTEGGNFTAIASDNLYKILTSNTVLDNALLNNELPSITTPYDRILKAAKKPENMLNWVLRTQGVYPRYHNEFYKTTTTKIGYDNQYWRVGRDDRAETKEYFTKTVSQSMLPTDAPDDFSSRTFDTLPIGSPTLPDNGLRLTNSAGILQNTFSTYYTSASNKYEALVGSAPLLWRKQMLTTNRSVNPWNINDSMINQSQWQQLAPNYSDFSQSQVDAYSGESLWEVNTQAGILRNVSGTALFESHPSDPWYDKYDDFRRDLRLVFKEFAVLPEYRIETDVANLVNYGPSYSGTGSFLEITGTSPYLDSTLPDFLKDYSNSEFMEGFGVKMSKDTGLDPKEIKLIMYGAMRFNPYRGFYPSLRYVQIADQLSSSYAFAGKAGNAVIGSTDIHNSGALTRPFFSAIVSPGILGNMIKSGLAVDYPLRTNEATAVATTWTGSGIALPDNFAWDAVGRDTAAPDVDGYPGGEFFDVRLPFEAVIEPANYLHGVQLLDEYAHPSCSLDVSCSVDYKDNIYSKMVSNFLGETPKFFLKNAEYSTLKSSIISKDLTFKKGDIFGMRFKLHRSFYGNKNYNFESGSLGTGADWGKGGAMAYSGSASSNRKLNAEFPVPQWPRRNPGFKPSFEMCSRPTSFGPSYVGRPREGSATDGHEIAMNGVKHGVVDCFTGVSCHTPGYYDGEAWCDVVFEPEVGTTYDLKSIRSAVSTSYYRFDPGPAITASTWNYTSLIPYAASGANDPGPILGGKNINFNVMQMSASINLFGHENVPKLIKDADGNLIESTTDIQGARWVVQPLHETPMLNFAASPDGPHPIKVGDGNLTLPVYGDASVTRGIWNQFGIQPHAPDIGCFMSVEAIPRDWLRNHYNVINNDTMYNRNNAKLYGLETYKEMKSLAKLLGFERSTSTKRLGELADSQVLREAVVAVPYIVEGADISGSFASGSAAMQRKKLIEIPESNFKAAMAAVDAGETPETGKSIYDLIVSMKKYIFPPRFDFVRNSDIKPFVMYPFEFEESLDADDLAYIWQGLAPRKYQKFRKESKCIAHSLDKEDGELLTAKVLRNENLRWMVFKVKWRGQTQYYDNLVYGEDAEGDDLYKSAETGYPIEFNWPYDHFSIVAMGKMDVQVLYKGDTGTTSTDDGHAHTYSTNSRGAGRTSYNDEHYHEIIDGMVQEADGHIHELESKE